MSNKNERELKEAKNLFADPKFARNAFRAIGSAIATRPAHRPVPRTDKEGNETFESLVERYTYENLAKDLKKITGIDDAAPTELEMIMHCQAQMARVNASNFVAWRDTVGAKPVDESKLDATINDFEQLSDEELELLAAHRHKQAVPEVLVANADVARSPDDTDFICEDCGHSWTALFANECPHCNSANVGGTSNGNT